MRQEFYDVLKYVLLKLSPDARLVENIRVEIDTRLLFKETNKPGWSRSGDLEDLDDLLREVTAELTEQAREDAKQRAYHEWCETGDDSDLIALSRINL